MQDYIRTLRMLNSTGTSYLDNISYMYYLYDSLGRLTLQGEYTGKNPSSSPTVLVQSYYDGYGFVGGTGLPTGQFTKDTSGYGRGSLTGSAVTVFGSSTKIYKAFYYDIKGRMTKSVQNNLLSGYDITSTVYTFSNKPSGVTHTHTASGKTTRTEVYTYTYDHADRISKVRHSLGGTSITLYDATYDNFGRLLTKQYHGTSTNKLTYAYNLRSWLTGISGTCFTQNLYYNTGVGTAKYNGSISSMTWKSGNESTVRGYKFTYDGLDRMLNATYGETASISTNANRFSENVTGYDKNGNIKSLQRYGQTGASAYGLIDNLTFTLNGNQLSRVDDAVSTVAYGTNTAFVNGASAAGEYAYDVNGNLTKDLNKGITDIQYNVLNLPSTVSFSDGSTITYTYGADGTKLRTVHKIGSTTTTTDYCGNVIYENGTQKLLLTEEGYINLAGTQQYHYYLKDHQGNNRVVINQSGTVEETNHYYPFGGVFATAGNTQPYKYNGKEFDTKKGLNWYDYGARHYDTALGRFTTNDRFAEKYYSMSPYQYGANSPVVNIDVNGDSIRICTETQSFGHTWISVGEGSNMTVYSYGRYNGTNKGPDRSSNSLGNGSGVLLKLMGDEAKAYNDKKAAGGMSVFVVTDVADEKVANILDEKFNMSTTMPDNPKSDYYNSSSARIIDEYKLTSNNCTTMVSDVLNKSGSNALKGTRLQQTSNLGTWTTIPIVNRFVLPISMQNHLVRISKPGGVVYKTR